MPKESEPRQPAPQPEGPIGPELPEPLVAFLRTQEFACVTQGTNEGTAFVIKAPRAEIHGVGELSPVRIAYELYQHPAAPVIRTVVRIYDRPSAPLALETFINVGEDDQRADFAALGEQEDLLFLFYDEELTYRRGMRVKNTAPDAIGPILGEADRVRAAIPEEAYDFDCAKAEVMRRTRL